MIKKYRSAQAVEVKWVREEAIAEGKVYIER
jgi:hypothetical protein